MLIVKLNSTYRQILNAYISLKICFCMFNPQMLHNICHHVKTFEKLSEAL